MMQDMGLLQVVSSGSHMDHAWRQMNAVYLIRVRPSGNICDPARVLAYMVAKAEERREWKRQGNENFVNICGTQ